jgi:hypothetical protein
MRHERFLRLSCPTRQVFYRCLHGRADLNHIRVFFSSISVLCTIRGTAYDLGMHNNYQLLHVLANVVSAVLGHYPLDPLLDCRCRTWRSLSCGRTALGLP